MFTPSNPLPPVEDGPAIRLEPIAAVPTTRPGEASLTRLQELTHVPGTDTLYAALDTLGVVWLVDLETGDVRDTPLLDLRGGETGFILPSAGESGLRSLAFHPDFATDGAEGYGRLYAAFSVSVESAPDDVRLFAYAPEGLFDIAPFHDVVAEFTIDPRDPQAAVDPTAGRELFRLEQPRSNHNFGTLAFNPGAEPGAADRGQLYFSIGDGGGAGDPLDAAQDLSEILGKIGRIDPLPQPDGAAYGVPANNPFLATPGALPEIFAAGFRNPQFLSFSGAFDPVAAAAGDFSAGALFASDIGQETVEELNIVRPGADHGWNAREGGFVFQPSGVVSELPPGGDGLQYPITQYDHESTPLPFAAIGGGIAYDGRDVPALEDHALFTDFPSGTLYAVDLAGLEETLADGRVAPEEIRAPVVLPLVDADGAPTTISEITGGATRIDLRLAETPDGEILAFDKALGAIYRVAPAESVNEGRLVEGTGADFERLTGTAGDDVIVSGGGRHGAMRGSDGADRFVFTNAADGARSSASVLDYDRAEGDLIDLGGAAVERSVSILSVTILRLNGADHDTLIVFGVGGLDEIDFA